MFESKRKNMYENKNQQFLICKSFPFGIKEFFSDRYFCQKVPNNQIRLKEFIEKPKIEIGKEIFCRWMNKPLFSTYSFYAVMFNSDSFRKKFSSKYSNTANNEVRCKVYFGTCRTLVFWWFYKLWIWLISLLSIKYLELTWASVYNKSKQICVKTKINILYL